MKIISSNFIYLFIYYSQIVIFPIQFWKELPNPILSLKCTTDKEDLVI